MSDVRLNDCRSHYPVRICNNFATERTVDFRAFHSQGCGTRIRSGVLFAQTEHSDEVAVLGQAFYVRHGRDANRIRTQPSNGGTRITVRHSVSIVTLAGQYPNSGSEMDASVAGLRPRQKISAPMASEGSPGYGLCFVVPRKDVQAALTSAHRECCLDGVRPQLATGAVI
jgi:hypothetical protein